MYLYVQNDSKRLQTSVRLAGGTRWRSCPRWLSSVIPDEQQISLTSSMRRTCIHPCVNNKSKLMHEKLHI
jgi:hypothetical protein